MNEKPFDAKWRATTDNNIKEVAQEAERWQAALREVGAPIKIPLWPKQTRAKK